MSFNDSISYTGAIAAGDEGTANLMNSCYLQRDVYANIPDPGNLGVAFLSTNGPSGAGGGDYLYLDNGTSWDGLGYLITDAAQTITGVKTFGSIPVLPASDPTTDNQAARKAYVDAAIAARVVADAVSAAESTTTSGTFQDKVSATWTAVNGDYLIVAGWEIRHAAGPDVGGSRLLVDGVGLLTENTTTSSGQSFGEFGTQRAAIIIRTLSAGSRTVNIQYSRVSGTSSFIGIRNASILVMGPL